MYYNYASFTLKFSITTELASHSMYKPESCDTFYASTIVFPTCIGMVINVEPAVPAAAVAF